MHSPLKYVHFPSDTFSKLPVTITLKPGLFRFSRYLFYSTNNGCLREVYTNLIKQFWLHLSAVTVFVYCSTSGLLLLCVGGSLHRTGSKFRTHDTRRSGVQSRNIYHWGWQGLRCGQSRTHGKYLKLFLQRVNISNLFLMLFDFEWTFKDVSSSYGRPFCPNPFSITFNKARPFCRVFMTRRRKQFSRLNLQQSSLSFWSFYY